MWWLLVLIMAICLTASAWYATTTDPVYRVRLTLVPAIAEQGSGVVERIAGQFGGLASLAGLGTGGSASERIAVATLRGSEFNASFVEKFGIAPHLFRGKWDRHRGEWIGRAPTQTQILKVWQNEVVAVVEDRKTGLITLQVKGRDRELVMRWATDLVNEINTRLRSEAMKEAQASIQYLSGELASADSLEVRRLVAGLLESQLKKAALAKSRPDFAFRVIDRGVPLGEEDYIWPRRILILAVGVAIGGVLCFAVLLLLASGNVREQR